MVKASYIIDTFINNPKISKDFKQMHENALTRMNDLYAAVFDRSIKMSDDLDDNLYKQALGNNKKAPTYSDEYEKALKYGEANDLDGEELEQEIAKRLSGYSKDSVMSEKLHGRRKDLEEQADKILADNPLDEMIEENDQSDELYNKLIELFRDPDYSERMAQQRQDWARINTPKAGQVWHIKPRNAKMYDKSFGSKSPFNPLMSNLDNEKVSNGSTIEEYRMQKMLDEFFR